MGLFKRLFTKKEVTERISVPTPPVIKSGLTITPLKFRNGYSEVFNGETYLGLTRFIRGRGCSCMNAYYFTPQNSRFVFTCKRESDLIKIIQIAKHLEFPKRLRMGYRDISTISSIETNQKRLTKMVNEIRAARLLASIKVIKKEAVKK